MIITDPLSGKSASISTSGNRLNVSARSDSRIYYHSRDDADVYITNSIDTAAAGEYNIYFQNDSITKNFIVHKITLGSAVLTIFKVATVTGTAAAGSVVIPVNMNRTSSLTAEATARGTGAITGLTEENLLASVSCEADATVIVDFSDSLILGTDDAIAVEYDTGAGGTMHATILGYYE